MDSKSTNQQRLTIDPQEIEKNVKEVLATQKGSAQNKLMARGLSGRGRK